MCTDIHTDNVVAASSRFLEQKHTSVLWKIQVIVNESISMSVNQTLHDVYLNGAEQTHFRITPFLGRNLIGGRNVGCHVQLSHTRRANCRPANYGNASICCRFGNQLDQVCAGANNTPVINKCTAVR